MKKKGLVTTVARTGGIKLDNEEVWYNPTKASKEFVKQEFRGQTVELDLDEAGKTFSFIKIVNGAETTPIGKSENINDGRDAKDRRIVRQNVLHRAVDLHIAGKIEYDQITPVAKGLESWVYRDEE